MCLSTVYLQTQDGQQPIMKDVARIEAEGQGYWLFNLLGENRFVEGTVTAIDLVDGHFIVLDPSRPQSPRLIPG